MAVGIARRLLLGAAAALSLGLAAGAACGQALTPDPWNGAQAASADITAARQGDVDAQIAQARRYETGDGVTANRATAVEFWGAASASGRRETLLALARYAQAGDVRAQVFLGRALMATGKPEDQKLGIAWLRHAAAAGSADANFIVACLLANSPGRKDRQEAYARFARAGAAEPRLTALSRLLMSEIRKAPSRQSWTLAPAARVQGAAWFKRGGPSLQLSYRHWGVTPGTPLFTGVETKGRLFEVAEAAWAADPVAELQLHRYLAARCSSGKVIVVDACAAYIDTQTENVDSDDYRYTLPDKLVPVGKMFELGLEGPPDYGKAVYFYSRALANSDDVSKGEAAYRLSLLAEKGLGMPRDAKAARRYLEQAGDLGQPSASYALGLELMAKPEDPETLRRAAYYFRAAGDGGIADGSYRYARLLASNKVPTRDLKRIYTYFMKAASAGYLPAINGVAEAYWNGWGVPVDEALAEKWWETAARAGDPGAAWIVAVQYSKRGDHSGAIPWLRRAAKGGHPRAQAQLNDLLSKGYHERNLGGFLMTVLDYSGEVVQGMAEIRAAQIEQENEQMRQAMMVYVPMSSTSSDGGTSGGSAEGSGSASSVGAGDGGGTDGGGAAGGSGGDGGYSGSGASSGYADSGGGNGSAGSGGGNGSDAWGGSTDGAGYAWSGVDQTTSAGVYADSTGRAARGGGSSDVVPAADSGGGSDNCMCIIVEDHSAEIAARAAEAERLHQEAIASHNQYVADLAAAKAKGEAEAQAEWDSHADERARTKAVCDAARAEGASCVSPQ